VQPPNGAVAVDHAVDGVPRAGLVRLGVVRIDELVVIGVHEPAEVLPFAEQLLGGVADELVARR
jgi:hypothetical protein